jgi:phosphatidylethanolamine/phosphatidyl-N-methylethanolamine N-methyltransferase
LLDKKQNPFSPHKLRDGLDKIDAKSLEIQNDLKNDLKKIEQKLDAKSKELKQDFKDFEDRLKTSAKAVITKAKVRKAKPAGAKKQKKPINLGDEAKFLMNWIESPLKTGSVIPSGKELATKMAAVVDLSQPGLVIELGPGTGPVTQALLDRGLDPARLILVEYSDDFVKLLRDRFSGVTVIQGDAYGLDKTLHAYFGQPIIGIISSLPLLTRPDEERRKLLEIALTMMLPGAPFVQFTYSNSSPIPLDDSFEAKMSRRIWRNIPPARVWTYQRAS